MLTRDAADSFDWHQWGKSRNTKRVSALNTSRSAARDSAPVSEPSARTVPPQSFAGHDGYPPPNRGLEYFPTSYGHPVPMIYSQQSMTGLQRLQPVGFLSAVEPYPGGSPITRYSCSPPSYGMYGVPASQTVYNRCVPQQSQYGPYPPQDPQMPSPANALMPTVCDRAQQGSQELWTLSETVQLASQAPSARPTTPVASHSPINAIQNDTLLQIPSSQAFVQPKGSQRPGTASNEQLNMAASTNAAKEGSAVLKKAQRSRQAPEAKSQAVRGSKRRRKGPEDLGQCSRQDVSSPASPPTKKKCRREKAPQSAARGLKRSLEASQGATPDTARGEHATIEVRSDNTPPLRVKKPRVKHTAGVQRLRALVGIPQAASQSGSTGQSPASSQAARKTCCDELIDSGMAASTPVSSPQVQERKYSHQLPVQPDKDNCQESSAVRPTHRHCASHQEEDNEALDAAMTLLSMRYGQIPS